jgi:hypothetical protein
VWSVGNIDNKVGKVLHEKETKDIECPNVVTVAANPFTNRSALVVCENGFAVYDNTSEIFKKRGSVTCQDALLTGGEFISDSVLAVWSQVS